MKTLTFLFTFTLLTLFGYSQETKGHTITITIDNIKNNDGNVLVGLHSEETFMKGKGLQNAKSAIENGKVKITFTNVQPGIYAILALHDINGNNSMDFSVSGMPMESYGMSNNPMSFGPPVFSEAKFEVGSDDLEMNIRF